MATIIGFVINGGNLLHLETTATEKQTEWKGGGKKGRGKEEMADREKKYRRLDQKLFMLQCHIKFVKN